MRAGRGSQYALFLNSVQAELAAIEANGSEIST
jgi:hypothetical protein